MKGFFGEINGSNFESAKAKYLSASLINELNAPSQMRALAPLHKKVQESFQQLAGGIDSVEIGGESIKGEQGTVTATLIMKWGAKESGSIELIKEDGKAWKISEWSEFKALGSEHVSNAIKLCNARSVDAAILEYQAALAENPRDSMSVYALGYCYYSLGKFDEAEAEFKRAIQMHPDTVWVPYLALGWISEARGYDSQAEQSYQRAIKNKPDYVPAYTTLARYYANRVVKLDHAIELGQKALELEANNADALAALGWVYYRKGDHAQALRYLAAAAEKAPNNQMIKNQYREVSTTTEMHLARAEQLLNQRHFDQAFDECEAALRHDPKNEQAKTMKTTVGGEVIAMHLSAAKQLFEKQKYDLALSECDVALRYDSQNAEARSLKAKISETKKALDSK